MPKISTKYLTLGSIVDKMITEEGYKPEDEYVISDINVDLSNSTHHSKILSYIKDWEYKEISDVQLKMICSDLGFKRSPNIEDESFRRQLEVVLRANNGENIISSVEFNLAQKMVDSLKNHEYTKEIFSLEKDFEDIEIIPQAKIFFKMHGVECKSMLDWLIVNHSKKVITPIDLKTGSFFDFMKNFYKYKYFLQGAMYHASIQSIVVKNEEFKDYKVDGFKFVYISREKPELPLIYNMDNNEIEKAFKGWTHNSGAYQKGIEDLVLDYSWYKENSEFDLDRKIVENLGVTNIKL
jgi:hypothetical protein